MQGDLEGLILNFIIMNKKEYMKPAMSFFKIRHHNHLLQDSGEQARKVRLFDDEMSNEEDVM